MRHAPLPEGIMKKALVLLFLITVPLAAEKMRVITTIFPVYDISRQVGGTLCEVSMLIPPGTESHSYEPTPRQIAGLGKCALLIYTNPYMEPWIEKAAQGAGVNAGDVINSCKNIALLSGGDADDDHEQHQHGGKDPHAWLDPRNAAKMTENIAAAFEKKDPGNAEQYRVNAKAFIKALLEFDALAQKTISGFSKKKFYFAGHFAYGYFVSRYGLEYASPFKGFSPDAEPTPKALAKMSDEIKKDGATVIYREELLSSRLADALASEGGLTVLELSAAHNVSRKELSEGITFLSILRRDLGNLERGLK